MEPGFELPTLQMSVRSLTTLITRSQQQHRWNCFIKQQSEGTREFQGLPQLQDSQKAERRNTVSVCASAISAQRGSVSCPRCPFPALPQRPGRQIQVISQPSASFLSAAGQHQPASRPPSSLHHFKHLFSFHPRASPTQWWTGTNKHPWRSLCCSVTKGHQMAVFLSSQASWVSAQFAVLSWPTGNSPLHQSASPAGTHPSPVCHHSACCCP